MRTEIEIVATHFITIDLGRWYKNKRKDVRTYVNGDSLVFKDSNQLLRALAGKLRDDEIFIMERWLT